MCLKQVCLTLDHFQPHTKQSSTFQLFLQILLVHKLYSKLLALIRSLMLLLCQMKEMLLELLFTTTLRLQQSIPTRATTIFQNQQSLSLNENEIVSDKMPRNEKGMKMKMIIKDLLSQIHFIATAVFIPIVNSFFHFLMSSPFSQHCWNCQ